MRRPRFFRFFRKGIKPNDRYIPIVQVGTNFYDTVEGCTLSYCSKDVVRAAELAFNQLSQEERRWLSFAPKDNEFVDRAIFWKKLLEPFMDPWQLRQAMLQIIGWYIHIKRSRQGGTP